MKQRFISFLLSAVMLLTMLPVTAFAADSADTVEPEIEIYFYADGEQADYRAGRLYDSAQNPIDNADEGCTSGNLANSMVVMFRNLEHNKNYSLMLEYPSNAMSDKQINNKDFTYYQNADTALRTIGTLKYDNDPKDELLDKLCSFNLNIKGTDFIKNGIGEYRVLLYENDKPAADVNNITASAKAIETITIEQIMVDLGTGVDPDDVLETETDNVYYQKTSIDGQQNTGRTAVKIYVNEEDIPNEREADDNGIRQYFKNLIRFQSSAKNEYDENELKRWFKEGEKSFVWRTQLFNRNISAAPIYDTRTGEDHIEKLYKENTYTAKAEGDKDTGALTYPGANTVKISATDLVKHQMRVEGTTWDQIGGWVGYEIETPADATQVRYKVASTENDLGESHTWKVKQLEKDANDEVIGVQSFYIDAFGDAPPQFCGVQYLGADNVPVTEPYTIKINTDGVSPATSAFVISYLNPDGYSTTATVPVGILQNLTQNADANDVFVIDSSEIVNHPDQTGLRITSSEVIIPTQEWDAVKKHVVEVRTPIGSMKFPAKTFMKCDNNLKLVMKRIERDNILVWTNFAEEVEWDRVKLDTVEITAYVDGVLTDIDLGANGKIDVVLNLDTVVVPDKNDTTKSYEEKNIDLLTFVKNQRGAKPTVDQRLVDYDAEKKQASFSIKEPTLYYGIMQRYYVDKMNTIDDRKIGVFEPDGKDLLSNFDGYADQKTYSIRTRAKELKITTTEAARLKEGSTITQAKREWTVDLSQITKKKIEIKIGVDVYTLDITRYLGDGEELKLKHNFTAIPGMDKITVTNAKKGRLYYVQCNKVKPNPDTSSSNPWKSLGVSYSIHKKDTDEDLVIYVSANTGGEEDRYIIFSIWEISEGAAEPIVLNSAGKFEMVFDETKDRHTEGLLIDPTQLS